MSWKNEVTRRRRHAQWVLVHRLWQRVQDAGVVTAETPAGRRFAAFGRGSMIAFPGGSVYGERWIVLGEDTLVGMHVTMSAGMVPGQISGPFPCSASATAA